MMYEFLCIHVCKVFFFLLYITMVEGNGDGNNLHVSFSKNDEINTLLGNQGTSLGL